MRVIIILLLMVVALALLRMLVGDVLRAANRAWKQAEAGRSQGAARGSTAGSGNLVQDPETGAYVAEDAAIQMTVDGVKFYFESEQSRDAFLRRRRET